MGRFGGYEARNHGFGKQLEFAGRNAIRDRFGGGHYGSVRAHSQRWGDFASWAREHGIRDARRLEREHLRSYGRELLARGLGVATIQNRLSTVNTTLEHMRGDRSLRISPSEIAGRRVNVRHVAPATYDRAIHERAISALERAGAHRAAAVLDLARATGMREREAIRADLSRLTREAKRDGRINIKEGAKGGRTAPRWVPASKAVRGALERAHAASPTGSRNLIAPHEKYTDARATVDGARGTLREAGVPGFHDARAAYAAERYREITGAEAPVIAGGRQVSKEIDRGARDKIMHELGHSRRDVGVSYLGSSK